VGRAARGDRLAFGDLAINYGGRFSDATMNRSGSRRVSASSANGKCPKGDRAGGLGVQFNLPLSVRVNRALVTHWNAGGVDHSAPRMRSDRQSDDSVLSARSERDLARSRRRST
jgi:hypothetical protein